MYPVDYHGNLMMTQKNRATHLKCEDCPKLYKLPRSYPVETVYVLDKVDSTNFKKRKFINLDDQAQIIAEEAAAEDTRYFVTARLVDSTVGKRLIVYAGERGGQKNSNTQIFIEPEIRRLSFDQADKHPIDVFLKLEATFEDGSKSFMAKG